MSKLVVDPLYAHKNWGGKIEVIARCPVTTCEEMAIAYTPGVAEPCIEIQKNPDLVYEYTRKHNLVAVITDGTAVLGLGDIGPEAAMPVMEGKCALFKTFADVDAFPICVNSKDTDEFIRTVELISHSFGGINLEDISAPRCFEIERKLKERCNIPVFHDDQHGTAIVVAAAIINACRLKNQDINTLNIVVSGAGAAAIAVSKLLISLGVNDIILCPKEGVICQNKPWLNSEHKIMAKITNKYQKDGSLADIIQGADVFIGLSAPKILTRQHIETMKHNPIIFAMANPEPEIFPDEARDAGAYIVGTGRSDFPNQINNVLAFPGIFRGVLDCKAHDVTEEMKLSAAFAIANCIEPEKLNTEYILPKAFDPKVTKAVADAVTACHKGS